MSVLIESYAALWLGCLILGTVAAACGWLIIHQLWRLKVRSDRAERVKRYNLRNKGGPGE